MRFRLALAAITLAGSLAGIATARTLPSYLVGVVPRSTENQPISSSQLLAQSAAPAPVVSDDYRSLLSAWLEGHKRYPEAARKMGEEGTAVLRFRVDRSGYVLNYSVVKSTGYADLDASVEAMMRAATLPPFPATMTAPEIDVSVTVRFGLTSNSPGTQWLNQAPTSSAAAYAQGAADWDALHAWFDSQTGDGRAGADFWAANRSNSARLSCAEAGRNFSGNQASYIAGCEEAKRRLDPIDAKRLGEPEYRAGFNDRAQQLPLLPGTAPPTSQHVPAAQTQLPTTTLGFETYPISGPIYDGPHMAPDLSTPQNYLFRSRITAASHDPPNFAGRYVVSWWGCGTGCTQGVAVNVATGKVIWLPGSFVLEPLEGDVFEYRSDSRLLIVNGHESEDDGTPYSPRCYELDAGPNPRLAQKDCATSVSPAPSKTAALFPATPAVPAPSPPTTTPTKENASPPPPARIAVPENVQSPASAPSTKDEKVVLKWIAAVALFLTVLAGLGGYLIYRVVSRQQHDVAVPLRHGTMPEVGARAVVSLPIVNGHGRVRTGGKAWAVEGPNLPVGTQVVIRAVQGARIIVEAVSARPLGVVMQPEDGPSNA